jgi:iron-sulfur cluster repair protein YtfE (RIC family)
MDIFETLRLEHAAMRSLLDEIIEKSTSEAAISGSPTGEAPGEDWADLLHDFKLSLIAHDRAEEAVFYDVLTRIPNRTEMYDLKIDEHHLAEELLADVEQLNPQDYEWGSRLALLQNQMESHIAEEETVVYAIVREAISDEEAERMAGEFEKLREELAQGVQFSRQGSAAINPAGLDIEGS